MLSGKSILFISPRFFGYENEIAKNIFKEGGTVTWYNHIPSSNNIVKALIRIAPWMAASVSAPYFNNLQKQIASKSFDWVFVLKGEAFDRERLLILRKCQPRAKYVYYSWDSLKVLKNSKEIVECFDKAYSFDRLDCIHYPNIKHLPLFYTSAYEDIGCTQPQMQAPDTLDLLFLGSIHTDRFEVVDKIINHIKSALPDVRVHAFYFFQSKSIFGLQKVFNRHFRKIPWKAVSWKPLGLNEISALIKRARILIDVQNKGQTGLTMRTIESLGAKRKLITTNKDIENYSFFDSRNIAVVDRDAPVVSADFIKSEYQQIPESTYQRYNISSWVKEIFS